MTSTKVSFYLSKFQSKKILNTTLEQFRRARERLREESEKLPGKEKRHFDFSENYIFGKLDNFCRRLGAIREIITKLRIFNRLHELRMDGIDEHVKVKLTI